MEVQTITVPYDSGHEDQRTGRGPTRFIDGGLERRLREAGHECLVSRIRSTLELPTENGAAFDLHRLLADAVRAAVGAGRFPLVLAGNCNTCVGTLAGISGNPTGIIWFDAHGDFNTPETTRSGFLDGMGLAMATGGCWTGMLANLPGFVPVSPDHVLHVAGRDLDGAEIERFRDAGVTLLPTDRGTPDEFLTALAARVRQLSAKVNGVYLHLDMDFLDTAEGRANRLACSGGLSADTAVAALEVIKKHLAVRACCLSSYDPSFDEDGRVLNAGLRLIETVLD